MVLGQREHDGAGARREARGVLEDVLEDDLEHALAGADHDGVVEPADQTDVAACHDLAEVQRRLTHKLREIGRHTRRLDQIRGVVVEALGGVDERQQAFQRGVDDFKRAAGALIVHRDGAPHRRQ